MQDNEPVNQSAGSNQLEVQGASAGSLGGPPLRAERRMRGGGRQPAQPGDFWEFRAAGQRPQVVARRKVGASAGPCGSLGPSVS